MKFIKCIATLAMIAVVLTSCTSTADKSDGGGGRVNIVGSTSVLPYIEVLAEDYEKWEHYKSGAVDVQGGGSSTGIRAATDGNADIGMSSRKLNDEESEALGGRYFEIAKDGLGLIIHDDNPVKGLTLEQIRLIYMREITNWKEVGGLDKEIHVVTREEGSGTRGAFEELVMEWETIFEDEFECAEDDCETEDCSDSEHEQKNKKEKHSEAIHRRTIVLNTNGAVRQFVSGNPNAIGYVSLGLVPQEKDDNTTEEDDGNAETVRGLYIDEIAPTVDNVFNGSYQLYRPFVFVTGIDMSDLSQDVCRFLSFLFSLEGQEILTQRGLVPVPIADKNLLNILEGETNGKLVISEELSEGGNNTK